jgi:hypothetical protein
MTNTVTLRIADTDAKGQLVQLSQPLKECDHALLVCLLVIMIATTLEHRLKHKGFLILPLEKTLTNLTQTAITLLVNLCRKLVFGKPPSPSD